MKGEIAVRYTIRHFDLPLLTFEANIHDKSKIPATSTMLQAKNSAGSASTRAGERVKSSGTGSF